MNSFKVVLLGGINVGKSSITLKFVQDRFNPNTSSTIGCSFFRKQIMVDKQEIWLNMVDSAGSVRFQSLLPMYVKNAHVVFLVYDITNLESFNRVNSLLSEVTKYTDAIIVLVGNKLDLPNRVIMYEEGKSYAYKHNLSFYEVSACTGEGIVDMFNDIAVILAKKSPPVENKTVNLNIEKEKNCCY